MSRRSITRISSVEFPFQDEFDHPQTYTAHDIEIEPGEPMTRDDSGCGPEASFARITNTRGDEIKFPPDWWQRKAWHFKLDEAAIAAIWLEAGDGEEAGQDREGLNYDL